MLQSLHQQARFPSHSSKIKKHMKMRREESRLGNLRFGRGGYSFLRFSSLDLLWLGRLLSFLRCITSGCSLCICAIRRSPESEVVSEKLHDECAVAVGLLGERIEFGNSVVKSLFGKVARTVWGVQDLVVEDREIEGQAETDGVSGSKLSLSDIGGILWIIY